MVLGCEVVVLVLCAKVVGVAVVIGGAVVIGATVVVEVVEVVEVDGVVVEVAAPDVTAVRGTAVTMLLYVLQPTPLRATTRNR